MNVFGDFTAKRVEHLVDLVQEDSCEVIAEEEEPGADFCNCFLCAWAVCMVLQRSIRLIAESAIGGGCKASGVEEDISRRHIRGWPIPGSREVDGSLTGW